MGIVTDFMFLPVEVLLKKGSLIGILINRIGDRDVEDIIGYALIFFFAAAIVWTMWRDHRIEKRRRAETERMLELAEQKGHMEWPEGVKEEDTRRLFLNTLTNIGCQYHFEPVEGDHRIFFDYQGEHFIAVTESKIKYIHLWDMAWLRVDLHDIDEISRLRKAINISNIDNSVTTVFTINDDEKSMEVHCHSVIVFFYTIPYINEYLKVELNAFFLAHQKVEAEMLKLREAEKTV